jgi:hypothetical protein
MEKTIVMLGKLAYAATCVVLCTALLMLCTSCGSVLKSSTHTVQGEATIRHEIRIESDLCDELEGSDKTECLKNLTEALAAASRGTEDMGEDTSEVAE